MIDKVGGIILKDKKILVQRKKTMYAWLHQPPFCASNQAPPRLVRIRRNQTPRVLPKIMIIDFNRSTYFIFGINSFLLLNSFDGLKKKALLSTNSKIMIL